MEREQEPLRLSFAAPIITHRGDGSYVITYSRPKQEFTPKEAAQILGISRSGVYNLLNAGILSCRRPTPRKILIPADPIYTHCQRSSDPEFWKR